MNINDVFPSKYIAAVDLRGQAHNLIMDRVQMEDVGGGAEKLVLYFQGRTKGLLLNKTNATTLSELYGPETDGWLGRPIQAFPTDTEFRGRIVPCIRLRQGGAAVSIPIPVAPDSQARAQDKIAEEDIPF